MRQAGGVGLRAMRCHASVAHNQILNGASVIFSPFISVELTCWEARTQPQVTAVFDPGCVKTRFRTTKTRTRPQSFPSEADELFGN